MNAVAVQASENVKKVQTIMRLYQEMKDRIAELTNSRFAIAVLNALFDKPIFQTSDFVTRTGIHKPTALGLQRQLKEAGILMEIRPASGRRFYDLLNC